MLSLGKQKHITYSVVVNDLLFCSIMSLSFQIIQGQKQVSSVIKLWMAWTVHQKYSNLAIYILPKNLLQIETFFLDQNMINLNYKFSHWLSMSQT